MPSPTTILTPHDGPLTRPPLPQREFVVMIAALMALNALAIDSMLPALPDISAALGVTESNQQQFVISLYFIGMAVGSLVHGPLADRFGRRNVILLALVGYVASALISGLSANWMMLLAMRGLNGFFGAAMGVVAQAVIRDRTSGDAMAKLMSMIFLIFMIVPIIAPTIGQGVLLIASWRWIFLLLAGMGSVMALWVFLRLPETLDPADKTTLAPGPLARTWAKVGTHRNAVAYMLASSVAVGANFGFLNSSQQIFAETFGAGDIFPFAFAAVALGMALANFSNSRVVMRFGARRVSHAALVGFILLSLTQFIAARSDETMTQFLILITLNMSMIGFIGANFSSIAMEPFGHVAGAASSFQNSARTMISALIGAGIGQMFDGTTAPLALGFLCCGCVALLIVLWGEKGRLFTRPNPPHRPTPQP